MSDEERSIWDTSPPLPPEPYRRTPRTEEELKTIAKDLAAGQIFTDRHLRSPEDFHMVFMALVFVDWEEEWAKDLAENCGMMFEYVSKSAPRSINGYPIFYSLQWLDKQETDKVLQYAEKVQKALDAI